MKSISIPAIILVLIVAGCANDEDGQPNTSAESSSAEPTATTVAKDSEPAVELTDSSAQDDMEFKPLTVGTSPTTGGSDAASASATLSGEAKINAIIEQLKPLQVILGQWRGTTRKEYDGFKAVDKHEWIWDLKGNPSLAIASDKSPYLRNANLTWDPSDKKFMLTATDAEGVSRDYVGDFTDPVHEIVGPDDKLHRVFRLQLTQTDDSRDAVGGDAWQIAFAQQENNRYLLEVDKRRGTAAFRRYDVVSTQRDGTSFALDDSDYGDKTCIISQGLGTTAVSYKGKTYWVCCSGCKAAFDEDPETWIARAEKRAAEKK